MAKTLTSGDAYDVVAIGWDPNAGLFRSQLDLYGDGYTVAEGMKTAKPRVFVAGDINDRVYRQVVTACASGCMAALEAGWFLTRGVRG